MLRFAVFALASALSTTGLAAQAASAPDTSRRVPADPALRTGRLPNGLRYFIRQNARPEKRAELRLVVNAGSVLEDPDQLGLAHFVEHMAFNGTAHFEKQALVDYIERIGMRFGADLNASTSFDETIYQLQVPTDTLRLLEQGFQILEDWAHAVSFDTAEIRKERGVVIEEWRLGQGARGRILRQQFPVLFRGSRYADHLPIGTKESLETFDPAALVRFYHDWYRPDLMAVIAVGDFDADTVLALITEHLGRVPKAEHPRPRPEFSVPPRDSAAAGIATDREATSTSVELYIFRPERPVGTVGAYRRSLVAQLYARMLNQRLYERSQQPDPPFIGAGGGEGRFVRGADVFSLGAAVADTGILRGFEAVLTEVERVDRFGFTLAELERTRREVLRAYEDAYREREKTESGSFAGEYVRLFLVNEPSPGIGYEFELVKQLLPGIELAEVNGTAKDWFTRTDRVLLASAPEKAGVEVPSGAALLSMFDRVRAADLAAYEEHVSDAPLVATPLAPAAIVRETHDSVLDVTRWTLANGVRVVVKPTDFKADEVLLSAISPGGTSVEPDSLYLAATFASQLVALGGVSEFSAVDLQKKLAGKTVQVSPFVGSYEEGFRGSASPRDLETLFQLIYLYATAPRPDPSAFQAFQANARALLANRGASPQVAFQDTLTVTLSQHHPRARPISPTIVDSLDLGRSISAYRDRFADLGDFTFVIVGNVSLDSLRPLVQRYLGNLPATRRSETWRDLGISPPSGVVERTVRRGVEPKSQTRIVFTGTYQDSRAERFVIGALAEVLDIKLREALREDLGGTYGVSVRAAPSRIPADRYTFSIGFGSAPDRVDELVKAVFAEVDSLQQLGAGEKELDKVRETMIRERETQLRQNGYWLSRITSAERYGEPLEQIIEVDDLLLLLTPARLKAAAVTYLDRKSYIRVTLVPETGGAS